MMLILTEETANVGLEMRAQKAPVMTNGISDMGGNCAQIRKISHEITRAKELARIETKDKKYKQDNGKSVKKKNSQRKKHPDEKEAPNPTSSGETNKQDKK